MEWNGNGSFFKFDFFLKKIKFPITNDENDKIFFYILCTDLELVSFYIEFEFNVIKPQSD